jgi:hypothetical protein
VETIISGWAYSWNLGAGSAGSAIGHLYLPMRALVVED